MPNLLENQLLLQYLSAAGQDIGAGNPLGANVNAVTQQQIATRNFTKLIQQMLSGKVPAGGKVMLNEKGLQMHIPQTSLQTDDFDPLSRSTEGGGSATTSPTPGTAPSAPTNPALGKLLNPSSSPLDISNADLAGLTTQDVAQALKLKLANEEIGARSINDLFDNAYKAALINQAQQTTELAPVKEARAWAELLREAPLDVPGLGKLDLDTWNKLDTKTKAYSYYAFDAKQRGEEVMGYNEWATQTDEPTAKELYDIAKNDPEFAKWLTQYRESGATRISLGETIQRKRATGWVSFENDLPDKVNKHITSREVRRRLMQLEDKNKKPIEPGTPEYKRALAIEKSNFIEDQLRNRGTIIDVELSKDGKVGTWTVRTKNGRTEKISYALYD